MPLPLHLIICACSCPDDAGPPRRQQALLDAAPPVRTPHPLTSVCAHSAPMQGPQDGSSKHRWTPLHLAAWTGDTKRLSELLLSSSLASPLPPLGAAAAGDTTCLSERHFATGGESLHHPPSSTESPIMAIAKQSGRSLIVQSQGLQPACGPDHSAVNPVSVNPV